MRPRPLAATITKVPGLSVGHASDPENRTGVTALVLDQLSPCAIDVRGGATCTYDTSSLELDATFGRRWAIFLSGGSVYGLDAARGVRTRLAEVGIRSPAFTSSSPIVQVSGATLYDLPERESTPVDYLPLGYEAARVASTDSVGTGRVGAGTGATVGKYLGRGHAMFGGIGSAAVAVRGVGTVGVLTAVNAMGAVRDPETNRWIAGARSKRGRIVPPSAEFSRAPQGARSDTGTTLVVVATDAGIDRRGLKRVAILAGAGAARVIVPVHASIDGDVVFAVGTRPRKTPAREPYPGAVADAVGQTASFLVARAIVEAVQ